MTYKVVNISAGYNDKNIISDISFEVDPSSLCVIIGENGSGKSTLLKALACQLKHEGYCVYNQNQIESMSIRERARLMSYLPQKSGVQISLPVLDVVLMGYNPILKLLEKSSVKQIEKAKEVLKSIGLEKYIYEDYQNLSEGQKQLVLLSRLMIEDSKVLLLDEIDSALDFSHRYEMMEKLELYTKQQNASTILCLHDLALALRFANQLILIKNGKVCDIIYPKKDSLVVLQNALSKIYKNIRIIQQNLGNETLYLTYWEDTK